MAGSILRPPKWFRGLSALRATALLVGSLALCNAWAANSQATELEPEFEADRLVIAAEQAIGDGSFGEAANYLKKTRTLGVTPPPEYHFFLAQLQQHQSQYAGAIQSLQTYVNQAGKQGRFYRQSLRAITQLEKRRQPDSANDNNAQLQWGGLQKGQPEQDYTQRLLTLYKTQSHVTALTRHINSLLKFYALPTSRNDYYELEIADNLIITLLRKEPDSPRQTATKINGARFSVYGVNPYLTAQCGKNLEFGQACWINTPHTSMPWLVIQANTVGADELEKALALLIKTLQQTG